MFFGMPEVQKRENIRVVCGLSNVLYIKCVHVSDYVTLGRGVREGEELGVSFRYLQKLLSGKLSK